MKIKQLIINLVDSPKHRKRLALIGGVSIQALNAAIKANRSNGPLTKYIYLKTMAELTGYEIEDIVENSAFCDQRVMQS
jgi:hypothetical protein